MRHQVIALVDDEEVFHWIARQFLDKIDSNLDVQSYYNGQEAIDHLIDGDIKPTLLLLDLNMPVANGWVFLEKYASLMHEHPLDVYMVSSSIDQQDQTRARSFEYVKEFISKPISIEILKKIIEKKD